MNRTSPSDATGGVRTALADPATIAAHPDFPHELRCIGEALTTIHDTAPHMVRYMASIQRWLLTQSLFVLQFTRDPANPLSGITAGRLQEIAIRYGAASRNTAAAHLAELIAYKMVKDVPNTLSKRTRPLTLAVEAQVAMLKWFEAHLASLDRLDGGNRLSILQARPELFELAHARAARALIANPAWNTPPAAVAAFVWTDSGSNVLHDLFSCIPAEIDGARIPIGPYTLLALAHRYRISLTSVRRLFQKAEELGALGWEGVTRSRKLWISRDLVQQHAAWQAVKYAAIAEAFDAVAAGE